MAPAESFGELEAGAIAALFAASADIVVVLDAAGVIRDVAVSGMQPSPQPGSAWIGRRWVDTVSADSRPKIESILKDAAGGGSPRWRHVNHAVAGGDELPVQYAAMQVGADGRIVAVGRDLRSIASLQQRLVAAQQSIERDYLRLRQMEMRYRLLFQATPDAVLIVEAGTARISEANPAAMQLLAPDLDRVVGVSLLEAFDPSGVEAVQTLLATVRATGREDQVRARSAGGQRDYRIWASVFRDEGASFFLVRMALGTTELIAVPHVDAPTPLAGLIERLPDAFVVADTDGRVLDANPAFLDLIQMATVEQVRGESMERWLGRPGVDLSVLLANMRQHGSVRLYATTLRGSYGATAEVEVSAAIQSDGSKGIIGFSIRDVGRRLVGDKRGPELPRSVEQLKELVGRVPLKVLVRETTEVVEQLCIEAALEITGDNRASAAEILGLSRQSLYVKLRRYNLGDMEGEADAVGDEV